MPDYSLIDTHCHLDFESFDDDRDQVIERSIDRGISDIIIPGAQKKYWHRIKNLCKNNQLLHPCYGLHPYWSGEHKKKDIDELDTYINKNRPVAVGECGLDFRPQQAEKKIQLYFFNAQLDIARSNKLPVVIHSVKATETVIKTIKKYKDLRGMVHSFSGSSEQARQLIDCGFFISISGSVTYDKARKIRKTAKDIPLTSLLLETDAPDQPDKLHDKKRNEPSYLINTLNVVAELRATSVQEIAEQTSENAKALFDI